MATGQSKVKATFTRPAKRDLSNYQYYPVQIDTDGLIDYASTAGGATVIGILQNKPKEGAEAEVAILGTSLLKVNAVSPTIDEGHFIGSENTNYRGVRVSLDKARYFAIALEPSIAANDLIEVLLVGGTKFIALTPPG